MDSLNLYTPAKINLSLEILERRSDGYHEIRTVFQKISLYDEVRLNLSSDKGIRVSTDDPSIPSDRTNLAHKAAAALLKEQKAAAGVSIHIKKKIPAGAGLGGGSSNAAATLKGLNTLLNLNLTDEYLLALSRSIGADVPFFLSGAATALAGGTGEKIRPLKLKFRLWLIVVFPNFGISTAWAYNTYSKYILLTKKKKNIKVVDLNLSYKNVVSALYNDFEQVVIPKYPEIKTLKNNLIEAGATGSLLSGSGSAVFGVFATREDAEQALMRLLKQNEYKKTYIAHSL